MRPVHPPALSEDSSGALTLRQDATREAKRNLKHARPMGLESDAGLLQP
jgi:hypothetical protein